MPSNHDTLTVNTVAYAIDLTSQTKGELGEMKFKTSAIAAIDTLIGLGWRPGWTEQERDALEHAISAMNGLDSTGRSQEWEDRHMDRIGILRAMLTGG